MRLRMEATRGIYEPKELALTMTSPHRRHRAATRIQSMVRGYYIRKTSAGQGSDFRELVAFPQQRQVYSRSGCSSFSPGPRTGHLDLWGVYDTLWDVCDALEQ